MGRERDFTGDHPKLNNSLITELFVRNEIHFFFVFVVFSVWEQNDPGYPPLCLASLVIKAGHHF